MGIALPDGWTNDDLERFIQAELSEDKPGGSSYPMFRAYGGDFVIYADDWGDTLYQIGADLTDGDGGKDMVWGEAADEVTPMTKYVKVAEMSAGQFPRILRKGVYVLESTNAVQFSETDGAMIVKRGVVFEPGEYPDKKFSATAAQLKESAARFKPVKNRVNHPTGSEPGLVPSYFDGHMGELIALDFDDEKNALVGSVAIPKWFDEFMVSHYPGEPLRNSLEIDRVTYDVVGNVLIPNPRVSASALMSAHAAFANSGGVVKQKERESMPDKPEGTPGVEPKTVSFADFERVQAEAAADRAKLATMAAERREEKAATFAETQIRTGKAVPAVRAHLRGLYITAAADDDAQGGTVKFAKDDGTEFVGTRVGALEAAFAALPATVLTKEFLPGEHGIISGYTPPAEFAKKDAEDAAAEARKDAERRKQQQEAGSRNGR